MVEPDELAVRVDQDGHAVEAQVAAERAIGLVQPRERHAADLRLLGPVEVLPGFASVGPAGLDLDEDERPAVVDHEIELSVARPVVAGEHLEPEALEVLRGEILPLLTRDVAAVGHGTRRYVGSLNGSARVCNLSAQKLCRD